MINLTYVLFVFSSLNTKSKEHSLIGKIGSFNLQILSSNLSALVFILYKSIYNIYYLVLFLDIILPTK